MPKKYKPKRKFYNDLKSFAKELADNGVKVQSFDGNKIVTRDWNYTLFDRSLITKGSKESSS
jgi:hypothetical protein